MPATNPKETTVYKKAFTLAMEIFHISKTFPLEEKYSLTSQIRRSSRSVCINLVEGYRKRRYVAHFLAKISDSDMENSETSGWLDFSLACKYITAEQYLQLNSTAEEIGRLLNHMLNHPDKY